MLKATRYGRELLNSETFRKEIRQHVEDEYARGVPVDRDELWGRLLAWTAVALATEERPAGMANYLPGMMTDQSGVAVSPEELKRFIQENIDTIVAAIERADLKATKAGGQ